MVRPVSELIDAEVERLDYLAAATGDRRFQAAADALLSDTPKSSPAAKAEAKRLLAELADRVAGRDVRGRRAAAAVDRAARTYLTGRGRHQREKVRMPPDIVGRPEGLVWAIAKLLGQFPAYSTIRKWLEE